MKQTSEISEIQRNVVTKKNRYSLKNVITRDFKTNKSLYLMVLPAVVFYIIFCYAPMYGAIIAFKDYSPMKGILGSDWIGIKNFTEFLSGFYFLRIFENTLLISAYSLVFEFPAPIIFALLLNEIKNNRFKKTIQTVTYFPYFISLVVICGLIRDFTNSDGIINILFQKFGNDGLSILQKPEYFRPIYIVSQIWQTIGWSSIIYLAALTAIDSEQYEAARIDGAGKMRQLLNITLPGILPTIVIMFILRIGNLMNVGFEKIILLYSPATYETADVISSFVYRKGLLEFSFSYSAAVGLFNSLINFILLLLANQFSKKITESSLW